MKLKTLLAPIASLIALLPAAPSFAQLNTLPQQAREALVSQPTSTQFYYQGRQQTAQQAVGDNHYQALIRRDDLNVIYFDTYSECPSGQLFVLSRSYRLDPNTNSFYGVSQRREDCSGSVRNWQLGRSDTPLGSYSVSYDGQHLVNLTLDFTDPYSTDLHFVYDWNRRNDG